MKTLLKMTALLACTMPAAAHNIWLEKAEQPAEYVVKFGHEQTETYPEHKLSATEAVLTDGTRQVLKSVFRNGEAYVTLPAGSSLVLLGFNNGVWCKMPNGKYVESTKAKTKDAVTCLAARKLGKAVIKADDNLFKSQNQSYELIPQAAPEAGKPLAVLALKNGQPQEGIGIGEGEDLPMQKTDAQGIAYYTPKAGLNRVWAEFGEEVKDNADYDSVSIEYLLTFELK